MKIKQIFFIS